MNKLLSLLTMLAAVTILSASNLQAQDTKPAKDADAAKESSEEKPDRYAVPDGGIEELTAFLDKLDAFRPRTRDDYIEYRKKAPAAIEAAAKKIMELSPEAKSEPHRLAKRALLKIQVDGAASDEEIAAAEKAVREYLAAEKEFGYVPQSWQPAQLLCRKMEYGAKAEATAAFHEDLAAMLDDAGMESQAESVRAVARRLRLPGNPIEIEGTTLDGKDFDLSKYKGKVVLVDFWATWCGPCRAELPNVKRMYRAYHEKGFDVIGISLDSDRKRLEDFLEKEKLPWVTLFEDGAGWKHPAAVYYGIHGIPTCILVDADGKVVSLRARGKSLQNALEERLGPLPPDEDALVGTWTNANRRTSGIAKLEIAKAGEDWTLSWQDADDAKHGPVSLQLLKSTVDGQTAGGSKPTAAAGAMSDSGSEYFLLKLVEDELKVEYVQLSVDGSEAGGALTSSVFGKGSK